MTLNVDGVEFEDPVEKERLAKVADARSGLEKWVITKTKIPLWFFRIAMGALGFLCMAAAIVFWILTYYINARVTPQ